MKKYLIPLLLTLSLNGYASSINSSMQASAQLQASCSVSIGDINLGAISYRSDSVTLGFLKYTCSKGVTGIISLSPGQSGVQGRNQKYMTTGQPGSDKLIYQFFKPGKDELGDGTSNTITLPFTGNGELIQEIYSVLVLRGQYLKPGNYSDSLTMTLTY